MTSDSINSVTFEEEAADGVEAAVSEARRSSPPFSIGLLLDATTKERANLDAIEEKLGELRDSIEQRRKTLDQQEELLRDLSESLD